MHKTALCACILFVKRITWQTSSLYVRVCMWMTALSSRFIYYFKLLLLLLLRTYAACESNCLIKRQQNTRFISVITLIITECVCEITLIFIASIRL